MTVPLAAPPPSASAAWIPALCTIAVAFGLVVLSAVLQRRQRKRRPTLGAPPAPRRRPRPRR